MRTRASHLFYHLKEEHNVIGFDIKNGTRHITNRIS